MDPGGKPFPSKTEYESTFASSASIPGGDSKNTKSRRDDTAQEAAEKRRIWAMAAASAAEMLKELTQKSPPTGEDMKKVFAPITPAEWAEKRQLVNALRTLESEGGEVTDAQVADELFYDPEATDDDLGAFLGQSDKDLKAAFRGSSASVYKPKGRGSKTGVVGFGPTVGQSGLPKDKIEQSMDALRKSIVKEGDINQRSSSLVVASQGSNTSQESQQEVPSTQNLRQSTMDGDGTGDLNRKASIPTAQPSQRISEDDFYYAYQDTTEKSEMEAQDETTEESEVEVYFPADVNINVDEALVGLESLLDDMRLESRITERFKYKLINKYSLLLQALITYQERETETITHLQTKRRILNALHQFVKTEAEAVAKAVITEETKEEDQDEGQVLDLGGKHEDGADHGGGKKKDSQGLSIEEMPAATIRETLLQQKNRLDVLDSIKKIRVLQLKQLEFERTLLNLHYSRMVKPSDLSKEIKDSRRFVNDLQLEISSLHQEMGQVQNEMRIQDKQIVEEEKSVEKLELEALTKQTEVQVLANKPVHIAKEADREAQKLEQLQDTHDNLCSRFMDSMEIYRSNQSKVDILATELTSLAKMENKLTMQKKVATRDHDLLLGQMEALMAREHLMLDRATMLTERMQHLIKQKKRIQEEQHRMFNDANKSLREAQKLERSIRMASDAHINAKMAYDKMRAAFDAVKPSDQNSNWEKLSRMLHKEIINLKAALDKKLDEANYKSEMVARLQAKLNELYEQQVASGKELQDLIRTTVRKRREREEKAEQCIKLESQIQKIILEKKAREIAINDCLRSEKIIFKQFTKIQKRFNTLKMEKSAIINELSAARFSLQETKQKIDDLRNKLHAYVAQTQMFESMTKEKYYIILNARIKRDSIKNDAMRSRQKFRFSRNQKMEILLNNKTLRREAEKQKLESIVIRKEFEKATNAADEFAIGYRIRIEEICTFHEYTYCYRKILLKGSEEITIREMEKSKLIALYEETRKHVFIVQMNQPDESQYFNKVERLRTKFYQITRQRRDLETKLNDDDNPDRVREIDFEKIKEKENIEVLEKRLDLREEYLAVRDVIGLERTLMENHLTKIAEDSLEQALYLKDFYGEQVKAIVNIRRNLNNVSQQMEGFICENAIASAQADIAEKHGQNGTSYFLYHSYNSCKLVLENAEKCWQEGFPPTEEMHQEWQRLRWRGNMLKKAKAHSQKPGFLYQKKPKNGTQIQAQKWSCNRRKLEDPASSVLGWNFSAVSNPIANAPSLKFKCGKRQ